MSGQNNRWSNAPAPKQYATREVAKPIFSPAASPRTQSLIRVPGTNPPWGVLLPELRQILSQRQQLPRKSVVLVDVPGPVHPVSVKRIVSSSRCQRNVFRGAEGKAQPPTVIGHAERRFRPSAHPAKAFEIKNVCLRSHGTPAD